MKYIKRVLMVVATIEKLEEAIKVEKDPRELLDLHGTLILLNNSLKFEAKELCEEIIKRKAA